MLPKHDNMPGGSLRKNPINYHGMDYPSKENKKDIVDNKTVVSKSFSELNAFGTTGGGGDTTVTLNDGNQIPVLALCTSLGHTRDGFRIHSVNHALAHKIKRALMAGYSHLDTAVIYHTEGEVGRGIQEYFRAKPTARRDDVYVTTKLWNDCHERKSVVPSLEKSLKRLQLDYVDLYLIHYPVAYSKTGEMNVIDYLETWKGMEEAKEKFLTRSIGVCNFNIEQMKRLWEHARIRPAVLQIEVNPTITQEELVNWCHAHDIVVMAYCPFGAIMSRKEDAPPVKQDHPLLKYLCRTHKKTVPQILLRYLIDRSIIPVPRITGYTHLKDYLDVFYFSLTKNEVSELSALNANYRVKVPIKWYPHPHFPFERQKISELVLKHVIDHSKEDEY